MSLSALLTIHLFMTIEILSFFVFPSMLVDQKLGLFYSALAGWSASFITPSVALSHEMVHLNYKKWYTNLIWHVNLVFVYIWLVALHHKYSHHAYTNTLKDFGHPSKDRNRLEYFYNYYIQPIPFLFNKEPLYFSIMFALSVTCSLAIYNLFGLVGVVYQIMYVVGFYYTTGSGNYFQHYGLELLPISDNDKKGYAWDDPNTIGKYFNFNLNIHSDHHKHPLKPFDKLKRLKGRPVLPYGIPLLMLMFMVPGKKFHNIMNLRLDKYLEMYDKKRRPK